MDIGNKSNEMISFEIKLRLATINKLSAVEASARIALNEAIAKLKNEELIIKKLVDEFKCRKDKN